MPYRVRQAKLEMRQQQGQCSSYVHSCQVAPHTVTWTIAEWYEALGKCCWSAVAQRGHRAGGVCSTSRRDMLVCRRHCAALLKRSSGHVLRVFLQPAVLLCKVSAACTGKRLDAQKQLTEHTHRVKVIRAVPHMRAVHQRIERNDQHGSCRYEEALHDKVMLGLPRRP